MTSNNKSETTVLATAAGVGGGSSTGVGASFAIGIEFNTTEAGIENGETVNGTAASSLQVSSTSDHKLTTTAKGGAKGGTAVGGGIAVAYVENDNDAIIGSGAGTLTLGGGDS